MNKSLNKSFILLLLLTVAMGWWDDGHMVVSKIAEIKLKENNNAAYEKFNELVKAFENFTDGKRYMLHYQFA